MTARVRVGADEVRRAISAGASPNELLDLADEAIEGAIERHDRLSLARLAELLGDAAVERGDAGLVVVAERARLAAAAGPSPLPPEHVEPAVLLPEPASAPVYAGWWRRVAAHVLDWVLIWTLYGLVTAADGVGFWSIVPLSLGYFTLMHGTQNGQTLGKLLLRIAVQTARGEPVGIPRALGRAVSQAVLWVTLVGAPVDALWPLADPRHRALHDLLAGTQVVRVG